ncbi:trypsin-like serine peptidase [Streptomyces gobiensis]|uniref:trypsin-like serine peptidase n=1 Tax=Streptomyces gobiensis TaxID=2875706 RepID=UPI001E606FAF|nr:trypsin-like peptidase domain-containing protein [Streptomyces gobiensis]UGY94010.1 trypsin-like peptidase domain-containing protein [Streptomyces gobiensis]
MPSIRKSRRRLALAATALAAALAVTATACGPDDTGTDAKPDSAASAEAGKDGGDRDLSLPKDLPTSLKDLEKWKNGGWDNWEEKDWLREAADFINPVIEDLWDHDRMKKAEDNEKAVPADVKTAASGTDPEPPRVRAQSVPTPYTRNAAPSGKIFMDTPKGPMVCSGTVVKDPRNPGKSNLVATAGHCVHSGKSGGWLRNIMFIPAYNNQGKSPDQLNHAPAREIAPYGRYWAEWAQTSTHWIEQGADRGGAGAQQDFAVLKVKPMDNQGKSLEQTVGAAVKINFNAPQIDRISGVRAYGYPAAPPYNGALMQNCASRPGRLTMDPSQPAMYRYGCSMTGGSSGGPVIMSGAGGKAELISVNSIGPDTAAWLAGPRLGPTAQGVFDAISKKYAGKS